MTRLGFIAVSPADPDEWVGTCSKCGFDALLRFPLTMLTDDGVRPFGHFHACARCWDMANNEREEG